jgi:aminomethyltransferase
LRLAIRRAILAVRGFSMKTTPLHAAHLSLSAKMGEFAGYDMPLFYDLGVLKEHEWTRAHAGLFDVSHMGQVSLKGPGATAFLESMTPSSFSKLGLNRTKYTVLTNAQGGIIDDLMVTKTGDDEFHMVINAGCKDKDIAWIKSHLPDGLTFTHFEDWALIALQGPSAERVMKDTLGIDLSDLPYMGLWYRDYTMFVSRLGYTGEDGFELSVPAADAEALWNKLLAHPEVKPIGLAARDSLRLEMGYCLYGHDIGPDTPPLDADLGWVMRDDAKAGARPPSRKRVGVILTDKGIAREGAEILNKAGEKIGALSSGGFSPTLKASIGQGYVPLEYAEPETEVFVNVRGNAIAAKIVKMPFVQPRTKRK